MSSFYELLQRKEDLEKDFSVYFAKKVVFSYNTEKITKGKKNILSKQVYEDFLKEFNLDSLRKGDQIVFRQIFSYLLYVEFIYTAVSISMLLNISHATVLHSAKVIKADLRYNLYRITPHIEKIRVFLISHKGVR